MHLRALRIDARHHVFDHVVLPRCVHPLKDQQQGVAIVSVEARLQFLQPLETFLAITVHLLSALEAPREVGRMPFDGAFIVRPDAKAVDVHGASVWAVRLRAARCGATASLVFRVGWMGWEAGRDGQDTQETIGTRVSGLASLEPRPRSSPT